MFDHGFGNYMRHAFPQVCPCMQVTFNGFVMHHLLLLNRNCRTTCCPRAVKGRIGRGDWVSPWWML